jgi:uncharacterized metal-binding protein
MSTCACQQQTKTVLLYACSGAANVAEVSDLAARQLMFEKQGAMYCMAGIGAKIPGMVETARNATVNLVIDGCSQDCARKCFDNAGLTNYVALRVTDLGIEKVKGTRALTDQVALTVAKAKEMLAKA